MDEQRVRDEECAKDAASREGSTERYRHDDQRQQGEEKREWNGSQHQVVPR